MEDLSIRNVICITSFANILQQKEKIYKKEDDILSKVNFKSYLNAEPRERLPSDLEIIVSTYGHPYLSLEETAACIGKSYATVYNLVRAGTIKSSHDGRRSSYRISASEIVRYMNVHQTI